MILTYLNINPDLLITLVASKRSMGRGRALGYLSPLGKCSAPLGKVEWENESGDQWHDMVSCKSQK